jgi:hypothetical protein
VLLVAGLGAWLAVTPRLPNTLPEYLAAHYRHDGGQVLARATDEPAANVERILARFDLVATPELAGRIGYIKFCPSLHGKGAHMVVRKGDGWVTVLYLPGVQAQEGMLVPFDDQRALLVSLPGGAAAIIDSDNSDDTQLAVLLRDSLLPVSVDA